ncbi:MAG: glycoside hydrolase family 2 [Clostridia bacterium]|nr:glycoside hydrolase family 2 [Clostridia bacterium]
MAKYSRFRHLLTAEGEKLKESGATPWNVYPRPQMARERWMCLNGKWKFLAGSESGEILVPFCPESLLSGFEGRMRYGETMKYERDFEIPAEWSGEKIIINFGAVSRMCTVYINGKEALSHNNAYLPFSGDITGYLKPGKNTVTVLVSNDLSPKYPWGKQKKRRGGIWYTPSSGIWQTVWLEPVPDLHIESLVIECDGTGADIIVRGPDTGTVQCCGKTYGIQDGHVRIEPDSPRLWSPEDPWLYRFTMTCGRDTVSSYFALRTLSAGTFNGKPRLCLNGKPYFFHGLLDQGYFSDGIYTPASHSCYESDIMYMKELGFNTLRKHIKVEPEQFYYDCDRLGMVVFQDMVNNGDYRFMRDTALPTIGCTRVDDSKNNKSPSYRKEFLSSMEQTVRHLSNHPCICYWTIFNEGWGQFEADKAYDIMRSLDSTRFIDSTSGWFRQTKSDVESMHQYFRDMHLEPGSSLPQVMSEFGGYAYKYPEHSFNKRLTYGYKMISSREALAEDIRKAYVEEIVPLARKGLCGSVYTQVSDVEDEVNGMVTYDRKIRKIRKEELADIAGMLREAVRE